MPKSTKQPVVLVALDYGGSLTKGLYQQVGSNQSNTSPCSEAIALLNQLPNVTEISAAAIADLKRNPIKQNLIDQAWVKVNQTYYAVGTLAKAQFRAHLGLNTLKYELAIPKTLAALWIMQQRLDLPSRFKVVLTALLPPGEYEDRDLFVEKLTLALKRFETPTGTVQVGIEQIKVLPEGGGIAMTVAANSSRFQQQNTAIVMLGFRNASVMTFVDGAAGIRKTSDWGFVQLIDHVVAHTSKQSIESLTPIVATAPDELYPRHFMPIVRSRNSSDQIREAERLITAVCNARTFFEQGLFSWLDEVITVEVDAWVWSGGTADTLKKAIRTRYTNLSHSFHGDIELPPELSTGGLGNRLADVYAAFENTVQTLPAFEVTHG